MKTRFIQALAIIIAGLGLGIITNQLKTNSPSIFIRPTPTPTWQEQTLPLTDVEQATMSGDFTQEFQQALAEERTPEKPLAPIWSLDIPSSMAGDIVAPTVTINGGPSEGSTIAYFSE